MQPTQFSILCKTYIYIKKQKQKTPIKSQLKQIVSYIAQHNHIIYQQERSHICFQTTLFLTLLF